MLIDYQESINQELNKTLKEKVILHKQRFISIFKARYLEMIPSLIKYKNDHTVSIDFLKVEIALRNGYDIVIGETTNRNIQVIGYATTKQSKENPADLFTVRSMRHGDITFVIPKHLRLKYYKEISNDDECQSGNFVVLRNKTVQYVSDYAILDHYVDELAEIVLSRYSISMQVKISNLFLGEPNDESINQIISDIYNGNPYIKGSKLFDPDEQIYHINNEGIAQNFQELKREYQNKISELNTMLGINSLAVEKSSGVSDEEVKSNRGYTTSNANIYLDGRNHGLKKLNKRYDFKIEALYNDEVTSEFSELHKELELEDNNEGGESVNDNNNTL